MAYIAKVVTIAEYHEITDKLKAFVNFHSDLNEIELNDSDKIIILQIDGTESYFPIFLKTEPTMKQIEEQLDKQETKLNTESKKLLLEYIKEN